MVMIATPYAVFASPSCPRCGTRMSLIRIFPDKPGYEQRSYECPRCWHEVAEVVSRLEPSETAKITVA
jgi:DNA-directed RNA polymerase subunit RPC12/RpoP